MKSVFLDYATVSHGDLDAAPLERALPGIVLYGETADAEVDARIAGAAVVLANKARLTRARMAAHGELRVIGLTSTGTDTVDLDAARERGVAVVNIRDYCTASVVQHVYAVLLALTHHLREYDRALKAGAWERAGGYVRPEQPVRELAGRTLGVVGFGVLGQGVARMAEAFGMRVLVANRVDGTQEPGRLDLAALLPVVDVLSLHCPLTAATHHLIGARELALMRRDAILINTARGGLVDAAALAAALRAGRLGGAAVDVLPEEPPLHGSPLLAPDLANLIVTPHLAWAAREARQRALEQLAAHVSDALAGGWRGRVA